MYVDNRIEVVCLRIFGFVYIWFMKSVFLNVFEICILKDDYY